MVTSPTPPPPSRFCSPAAPDRLAHIGQKRRTVLYGARPDAASALSSDNWIDRSWLRSLANGHRPEHAPSFEMVAAPALRRTLDANHLLVQAARPVLDKLARAIADSRYFAILTNQDGVVVDAHGAIDRSDRRADLITRIGTDLSEHRLATTAIGAALTELQPVWLHRGEHFFEANSVYSCAGAPLFGPSGVCVGMLDLTGIEAAERPELMHLVAQSARSIENALTLTQPHSLLIRLNWPGRTLGDDTDGLVCVDADGYVQGANQTARQMLPQLSHLANAALHCSDLFAMAFEMLFDMARRQGSSYSSTLEVPLWTGLRLHAMPLLLGQSAALPRLQSNNATAIPQPLRDVETALIRRAVDDAKGNVMKAARTLGISRATVYRRLGTAAKR
ncbi:MAG: histidine kinase [Polaromonas sp.]|nr:histidine kinase [Polaromonas sp.]